MKRSEPRKLTPGSAWDLADRVGHAYALLADVMARELMDREESIAEVIAMAILQEMEAPLSQSEWGRLQGVSRQRAHTVTKALGSRGLVDEERRGRESYVRLTAAGRRRIAGYRRDIGAVYAAALESISPKEASTLAGLADRLIACLSRVSAPTAIPGGSAGP